MKIDLWANVKRLSVLGLILTCLVGAFWFPLALLWAAMLILFTFWAPGRPVNMRLFRQVILAEHDGTPFGKAAYKMLADIEKNDFKGVRFHGKDAAIINYNGNHFMVFAFADSVDILAIGYNVMVDEEAKTHIPWKVQSWIRRGIKVTRARAKSIAKINQISETLFD